MPCEESRRDHGGGGQSVKQLRILGGQRKKTIWAREAPLGFIVAAR